MTRRSASTIIPPFQLFRSYASLQTKIMWRIRTPLVLVILLPLLLTTLLGNAAADGDSVLYGGPLGWAVMFSFLVVNYAGLALYDEYTDRTFVRQCLHKPPRSVFLLGKLTPAVFLSMVSLIFFSVYAVIIGTLPLSTGLFGVSAVYVLLVIVGSLLGAALFVLCPGPQSFQSLTFLLLICFAAVGGAIVRTEHLPAVSRALGYATPHYWAVQVVRSAEEGRFDLESTVRSCVVLASMAVLLGAFVWKTFSFHANKSRAM